MAFDPSTARIARPTAGTGTFDASTARIARPTPAMAAPETSRSDGPTVVDVGKALGAGVVSGLSYGVRGIGESFREGAELITGEINRAQGWDLRPANFLKRPAAALESTAQDIRDSMSAGGQQAMADSAPTGDITSPSTWSLGKRPTVGGYVLQAADVGGQIAPVAAAALLTRGQSLVAQGGASAASAAVLGGGGAASQEGGRVRGLDQAELDKVPLYASLVQGGMDPAAAREETALAAEKGAFRLAAPTAAISGLLTGGILSKPGQAALSKVVGNGVAARAVGGVAIEAPLEGAQEALETVAMRAGASAETGEQRNLTEGTFGDAVLGAGGTVGPSVLGAVLERPAARFPDAKPGSLSDAVNALPSARSVPEPAGTATRAPIDAVQPTAPSTPAAPVAHGNDGSLASAVTVLPVATQPSAPTPSSMANDGKRLALAAGLPQVEQQLGAATPESTAPAPAQPAAAAVAAPVVPPWVNTESGEASPPTPPTLLDAMRKQLVEQYQAHRNNRVDTAALADAWGVPRTSVLQAHKSVLRTGFDPRAFLANNGRPSATADAAAAAASPDTMREIESEPAATAAATPSDAAPQLFSDAELKGDAAMAAAEGRRAETPSAALAPGSSPAAARAPLDTEARDVDGPRGTAAPVAGNAAGALPPVESARGPVADAGDGAGPPVAEGGAVAQPVAAEANAEPVADADQVEGAEHLAAPVDVSGEGTSAALVGQSEESVAPAADQSGTSVAVASVAGGVAAARAPQAVQVEPEPAGDAGAAPQPIAAAASPVQAAADTAATSPANDLTASPAQLEANNAKVGRLKINGFDVSVQFPAGVARKEGQTPLARAYGHLRGTRARDGDQIDVFLGDRADDESLPVFVVDQVNERGEYDEAKVVLGEADEASARAAYLSNYPEGWTGLGAITQMSHAEFRNWARSKIKSKRPASKALLQQLRARAAAKVGGPAVDSGLAAKQRDTAGEPPSAVPAVDPAQQQTLAERPQEPVSAEPPPPATRVPSLASASPAPRAGRGVPKADVDALVQRETAGWEAGPNVVVLDSAEQLPEAAKRDPAYRTAEGLYDGRRVYLVAENLRDVDRARRVLAHEAVGHFGVERIMGDGWDKLVTDIKRLAESGTGSKAMRDVLADVKSRYPDADDVTFAKETIAVMAERGVRNALWQRLVGALRKFLRQILPNLRIGERDLNQLLIESARYLRQGESQQERVRRVEAMSFSAPEQGVDVEEMDGNLAFVENLSPAERESAAVQGLAAGMYDEQGTDSPFFRTWFKASKVQRDGAPVRVYHGTATDFDAFDTGRLGGSTSHMTAPLGFFFTEKRDNAERYAELASRGVPAEERVIEAFLSLQKPVTMTPAEFQAIDSTDQAVALRKSLIGRGYDGIHIPEFNQWIAFQPTQVKAVTNRGTFDAAQPNMLFSKPARAVLGERIEQLLKDPNANLFERLKGKIEDWRPTWLGALTLRHLGELAKPYLPQVGIYNDLVQQIATDRNLLQEEGAAVAEKWQRWAAKNRVENSAMVDLMHESTIAGTDPAEDFREITFRYAGKDLLPTRENVKQALLAIREQMRGRAGDAKKKLMDEAKRIRGLAARNKSRRVEHASLHARFAALSPAARELYREVRDLYAKRMDQREEALVKRVKDMKLDANLERAQVDNIRLQFETARIEAPYFPLHRVGDFWIAAKNADGEPAYVMRQTYAEWQQAKRELVADGFTITKAGRKGDGSRALEGASGAFVADVIGALRKRGAPDSVQDEIWQLYLESLPDLSQRKHSIHRKKVAGYSQDAIRAFGSGMMHEGHQLARLRYSHQLEGLVQVMTELNDAQREKPDQDWKAINAADAMLTELKKRHAWIMNPSDSKLTNMVSSLGFVYYLGLTPAAALVNLTQTAITTFPALAANPKVGPVKAMNLLLAGMRDSIRTGGNIQRTLVSEEEQAAYRALRAQGAIDKTQAHNLAGIAESDSGKYNPAWSKAMNIVSVLFHKGEVVNREASGMAAFRAARAAGDSFESAVRYASDIIQGTHFDYSNANRARFMQSGTAKVLLMFRQYSLNMTWFLARNAYVSLKGESPEVRRQALRTLTGTLGMTGVFSGVLGLPVLGMVFGLLNAAHASFGDDDEPWDAETEFRNFLADHLGAEAANVLATGPVNALTGVDIGGRVSLDGIWFRNADRELEGRDAYFNLLEQVAGPMGGIVKNLLVGKQLMDQGHLLRGVETMMPKALKDGLKGLRYATQGANNLRGDPIVPDLSAYQTLLQLGGFTPAAVAEQYDANRAMKNYESAILQRRQGLMDAYAMAVRLNDAAGRAEVVRKVQSFNRTNPEIAITNATIRRSIRDRMRYSQRAEGGIVLNRRLERRTRESARFGGE
jgi:hypothetical protein